MNGCEMNGGSCADAASQQDDLVMGNLQFVGQILIDYFTVLDDLLAISLAGGILTVAWVLHSQNAHLQMSTDHLQKLSTYTDVFRVPMEIYYQHRRIHFLQPARNILIIHFNTLFIIIKHLNTYLLSFQFLSYS